MNYSAYYLSIPVPFRLSWGKLGYSRHVILKLTDAKGNIGWGEGVLYKSTFSKLIPEIWRRGIDSIDSSFEPAVICAVDMAKWDLKSREENRPLSSFLGAKTKLLEITEEIFIDSEKHTKTQLERILSHGTTSIKLKIGRSVAKDLEMISFVNLLSGGKLKIGLDANRAYKLDQAIELVSKLDGFPIKVIEEPINGTWQDLARLKKETKIPIMLDESIKTLENLDSAIKSDCFSVLNIKLTRLGGISNALKYIDVCKKNKVEVYIGCNEELDLGMQAIIHLGSSIANVFGIEGVGPDRLKCQISDQTFNLISGKLIVSTAPGLGIENINLKLNKPGVFLSNSEQSQFQQIIFMLNDSYGVLKTRLENILLKISP